MNLIVLEQVGSTNTVLKDLLRSGEAGCKTVVYSESQTSGYGRRGKFWYSETEKNISVSLSLRVFDGDSLMSLAAGVAVIEALTTVCGADLVVGLKWPNDLVVGGKKLCGISCEKIGEYIVLGIGVNVNNANFPEEIAETATSLYLETGKIWNLIEIRNEIIKRIFAEVDNKIIDKARQHCVNLGQKVRIINNEKVIAQGIAQDLNADGSIKINGKDYYSGEISLRME